MHALLKIKSTVQEPIQFFLMYPNIDRNSLYLQYKKLDGYDGYFDSLKNTAYVKAETRIDKDVVETSMEEFSFEDFIRNRFSDEVSKSKALITKFYKKVTVKNELELSYEKLLRAFVENLQQFKNYPTYPESELLPSALKEIVKHFMHLCRGLFTTNSFEIETIKILGEEEKLSRLTVDIPRVESKKQTDEKPVNHSDLYNALSKYIKDISLAEFTNIVQHHTLSLGTQKAQWTGKQVDAHRFASFLKMSIPKFNQCFLLTSGRKLKHNNKDKLIKQSDIVNILKKYLLA